MNKRALLQLSLAMTIFGSIGFFSKFTGLSAIELVFVRCVCATIFLGIAWIVTGQFRKEKWDRKEIFLLSLCGITNLLNWVFLFKSFELISVTIAISLYHLAPMIVLLLGSIIFKEKLTGLSILAIFLCFMGTVFMMGTNEFQSSSPNWNGMVYGIIAAFFYAATMLLGKSISKTSVYATTFIQMVIGVVCLIPFVHFSMYPTLQTSEWLYAIFTGIVHTGIVYLLFFQSIRYLPTNVVSFMIFVDPAVAILLDIIFTNFHPNWLQFVGVLFIFSGLFYTLKAPTDTKKTMQSINSN